ncbi:hypothetical protein [Gracilimonas sediminicola]|uniref:Uncharacterized protein n=1 Tax=Gracilimonas sediminicola TaxID=2952158 RepID=A0A9X2L0M8_9BACT|nr:hypothetical protein [Gracilimonas sediminicola]MCP9289987.1 hypothetical protein [Gracilimonas sediminicola]
MALVASKIGIEKFVYKADAADITFNGEDIIFPNSDDAAVIQRIIIGTAKGSERTTGNKIHEITFQHVGTSVLSDVETDDGNLNDFEIWQLGSTSADETFSNVNLVCVEERAMVDPESEDMGGQIYRARVVSA